MRTEDPHVIRLADYRPPDFLIDRVHLDIRLDLTATKITSRLAIRPNPVGHPGVPLVLDGDELVLLGVTLNARPLEVAEYSVTPDKLTITEPPQAPFELEIETELNPSANTKLMGLYRSGSAYCTQCEAEGFRRITYFLDRPDVLSVYTTRIEAERAQAPILLSNGNLVERGDIPESDRHYAVWHDPFPKPSYLFALVGGDLGSIHDTFTTRSGREVDLAIYVEHGNEPRATYAMDALKRAMRWDETAYGREYDLDIFNIVAVSDFNMGAMENKGLNIFNDKYVLALPETATDADYAGIERVIAHEYLHNWTGNRITCRDWFQLCLKEGLTVFRDQEFTADQRSRAVQRIADVRTLRAQQFSEDAGPLAHNVRPDTYREINNFYTATVYEKGAEIVRMLKVLVGDDAFARGVDLYFERYDGTAATIEDFLSCFEASSRRDLQHFSLWYKQAGTPCVTIASTYDADAKTLSLDVSQDTRPTPGQPDKKPLVIPLALGLIGRDGAALPLKAEIGAFDGATAAELSRGIIELTTSRRRVVFRDIPQCPVISALRGFSAPVQIVSPADDDDLALQCAHDRDPCARWQAAQTYATRLLLAGVRGSFDEGDKASLASFSEALRKLLSETDDPAFSAQVLNLPSEADIARDIGENVDPDTIHRARQSLRADLGRGLRPELLTLYRDLASQGPYSPDAVSTGRRALRNAALDLLTAGDEAAGTRLAKAQFQGATNMTDRVAALGILCLTEREAREEALDAFYDRYAGDALVIDKWLSLQAMIPHPGTIDRVRRLMRSDVFSMSNPNRVRALIGAFATANQRQFHAPDGSGYEFVGECVLLLDPKNPHIAARLLSAFRTWRMMEPVRRQFAEAALRRVQAAENLSPDVKDIVERSLA
ncbi:MAG: aminopeptidase [Methylobacteriaceae bacterium]|nr:aminopeptidase [Methylobacteriaceae bacterium]